MLSKTSGYAKRQVLRSFYAQQSIRSFAAANQETLDNLKKLGITNKNIVYNPT